MSRPKFSRLALDAGINDEEVTKARIDTVFLQASGGLPRLTFEQFLDAMVLLGLAKYGETPGDGREVVYLVRLHEEYMSSFQAESGGTDPLGQFVRSIGDDWFEFLTKHNILTKLYRLYERYFPREVNPHFASSKFEIHVADQNKAISH